MSGWTAGPWKVYHEKFRPQLSDMKIIEVQDDRGKSVVFWTGFDSAQQSKSEKLANARLIAASPELLEACKGCLGWLSKIAADHDGDDTGLSARAMKQYETTHAAIARAEGRES